MVPVIHAATMAFPETADQAMVGLAMADQATTDAEAETVDHSIEHAFFEGDTGWSERPVSFDTELSQPSLDLEARELRRAHFTRVVGGIMATLGIGALFALAQPRSHAEEAAPVVAAPPVPQELPEMQLVEAAPEVPPAASSSAEPAPSVSAATSAVPRSRQPAVR